MSTNAALDGQRAAEERNYLPWLFFGIFGWLFGPLFAHVTTPTVPPDVLAKGAPSDAQQQQVFIGAYIGQAKNKRIKFAWIGFVVTPVLAMGACVACGLAVGSAGVGTGISGLSAPAGDSGRDATSDTLDRTRTTGDAPVSPSSAVEGMPVVTEAEDARAGTSASMQAPDARAANSVATPTLATEAEFRLERSARRRIQAGLTAGPASVPAPPTACSAPARAAPFDKGRTRQADESPLAPEARPAKTEESSHAED